MAIAKATWEALETKIVSDMSNGVNIGSYTIGRRTFSYRSLDEQRRLLIYVQSEIRKLTPGSLDGTFALARFAPL